MPSNPAWFLDFLNLNSIRDHEDIIINGHSFSLLNHILRSKQLISEKQSQTKDTFGFKWAQEETFNSTTSLSRARVWLSERYGDCAEILNQCASKPLFLDAGCGAGLSALELWRPYLSRINYLGVDISEAVDVARKRFLEENFLDAAFMQADLCQLPYPKNSFDIIFSEGVMHHTDSTHKAFQSLTSFLKPGGFFLFYIYRKKGPIREFTDDYIREKLQTLSPEEAWKKMEPLTELGIKLGELDIEIDIPKDIALLEIPSGKMSLQRLFYWHIFKAYYHPTLSFSEMNHINFDWYAPKNAHRHTLEEIQKWCEDENLTIHRLNEELSGFTVICQKRL